MRLKYLYSHDSRSEHSNAIIAKFFPELLVEEDPQLIIVSGGDGAMLHAIQKYKELGVPFLGKAQGTLNFLMNDIPDLKETIDVLLKDRTKLFYQKMKTILVGYSDAHTQFTKIGEAVNEVVIGDSVMGYHHMVINSEQHGFFDYELKGSGLCMATPIGSTGFNFNNQGTILPLNTAIWSFTGIVTNKHLNAILPEQVVRIKNGSAKTSPSVFTDGILQSFAFESQRELILKPGRRVSLAFLDETTFAIKRTKKANPG